MKRAHLISLAALAMLATTAPAFAHAGATGHTHGLLQPVGGAGHVLALAALGLLAVRLGWIAIRRIAAAGLAATGRPLPSPDCPR